MATNPIQAVQDAALENMKLVAEAEVRLAAAGQTSLATWEKQAAALRFLNDADKKKEVSDKQAVGNAGKLQAALGGVNKGMLAAAAATAGTFAELNKLASAASPGLARALSSSFELLTAELGSALLPVTMDVTESILELADWVAGLDDTTKTMLAGGVLAIPALTGVGFALNALGPAARLAATGIRGLYAALGPLGATVAAIGVAAAGTAASLSAADYFSSQGKGNPELQEKAGQQVTEAELQQALDVALKHGGTPEGVWQRVFGHNVTAEEAAAQGPEGLRTRAQAAREEAQKQRTTWITGSNEAAAKLEDAAQMFERAAASGYKPAKEESAEKKQEALMRRATHYNAIITEVNRVNRPQYSALAEARKQLQLNILGKSPIEQRIYELQRRNAQRLQKKLDDILRQLNEGNDRQRRQV